MEDPKLKKHELRNAVLKRFEAFTREAYLEKCAVIQERLLDFANFQEAKTILLYQPFPHEVDTHGIMEKCVEMGKVVLLPVLHPKTLDLITFKMDGIDANMRPGAGDRNEPDPRKHKVVPLEFVDLSIIPGSVFDERGGRIGYGRGSYDRLIPQLPMTTRKVSLAFETQLVSQVPMEAHDRYVDIIITEKRVIYKI